MKSRFPRSRNTPGAAAREKGSTRESPHTASRTNAIAESPWPTMKDIPKIDEYQWGASDISQSTDAKNVVAAYRMSPGAESRWSLTPSDGSSVASCSADQRLSRDARPIQTANSTAVRIAKNGTFRYPALARRIGSDRTASGRAQRYRSRAPKRIGR